MPQLNQSMLRLFHTWCNDIPFTWEPIHKQKHVSKYVCWKKTTLGREKHERETRVKEHSMWNAIRHVAHFRMLNRKMSALIPKREFKAQIHLPLYTHTDTNIWNNVLDSPSDWTKFLERCFTKICRKVFQCFERKIENIANNNKS